MPYNIHCYLGSDYIFPQRDCFISSLFFQQVLPSKVAGASVYQFCLAQKTRLQPTASVHIMSETVTIAALCVSTVQSLIIFLGNTFTVFVFWIHRNKLKRTYFLLINLAVADLLVGLTQMVVNVTFTLPRYTGINEPRVNETSRISISTPFQATFLGASMFFLALISLERAFALIWPLRHRATSIKTYIIGVAFVWLAGIITVGVSGLLNAYGIDDRLYYIGVYSFMVALSLVVICVSYLSIRTRLYYSCTTIATAHNKQSYEQNTKLSRTLFVMIGASTVFWVPSLAFYCTKYLSPGFFPNFGKHMFPILHLSNSLVNPIIYSLRMPVFRETLKRLRSKLRIRQQSKRYTVNHQT